MGNQQAGFVPLTNSFAPDILSRKQRARLEGEAAADSNGDFDGRFPFLMTTPKPIIAAINGAVAGMAFPFSLCCDLRVGTEKSLFLTAFAQRGLIVINSRAAVIIIVVASICLLFHHKLNEFE